uniref:Uncharacterized protein n=1 Tax=viral metagenome TaxID=1070528 RepID=A0A6C0IXV8_9ZZZZ
MKEFEFITGFDVSDEDISPRGLAFNNDGTKMFLVGLTGKKVIEYTLSRGFDVTTARFVDFFSLRDEITEPMGLAFNNDGTKMFVVDFNAAAGQDVNEYTLPRGFDVSTASFVGKFNVKAEESQPVGLAFNNDGTKMFVVGYKNDKVSEYALSRGFDLSTASFVHAEDVIVRAGENEPRGIAFNNDGTMMFVILSTLDEVNIFTLSTGFDVSTASFVRAFNIRTQDGAPTHLAFNNDGTRMFVVGRNKKKIFVYATGLYWGSPTDSLTWFEKGTAVSVAAYASQATSSKSTGAGTSVALSTGIMTYTMAHVIEYINPTEITTGVNPIKLKKKGKAKLGLLAYIGSRVKDMDFWRLGL